MRELWAASRPFSWINTCLPFLAAAIGSGHRPGLPVALGALYFLLPYNLLMYGVNDLFDYASDRINPRKGGAIEGAVVPPRAAARLWLAAAVTNVPLLVAIWRLAGPVAGAAVTVTSLTALAYSVPPLRTKVVPGLDTLTSSLHFTLPCACGALLAGAGLAGLPWRFLAAFLLWGVASHALGAIQDVGFDRSAGLGSIAVSLGAQRTALLSMVCYSAAVVITALAGGAAVVAAATLAPYVLLAASCVGGDARQARRAWKGFLGMNLLAGFVVTQVLLHLWVATPLTVAELFAWGSAMGAVACLGLLVVNLLAMRRTARPGPALPPLTAIIPARNEAGRVGIAAAAVARQDYPGPLETVVVDDASEDGTAEEAKRALAGRGGRVLRPAAAPPGWTGKCWACQAGAAAAGGRLLAFVDADTVLRHGALAAMAAELCEQGGGMVSILTRYELGSRAERVLMPAFVLMQSCFLPTVLLNATRGRFAFAYGPCMLVSADDYLHAGGHAAIRSSEREDVDLARLFARNGSPVRFLRGADLAATRHFRSARAVAACWRRTFYAYSGGSLAVALAGMLGTALVTLLPLAMLPVSLALHDASAFWGAAAGSVALLALRLVLAWSERQPPGTVLWHPVTFLATLVFQAAAIADGIAGVRPIWRGRRLAEEAQS